MIMAVFERTFSGANERFVGKKQNEKNVERFNQILFRAKALSRQSEFDDITLDAEDPNNNRSRNCIICLDVENPALFMEKHERSLISEMILLCDSFVTAITEDKMHVRYSFGVQDIWSD